MATNSRLKDGEEYTRAVSAVAAAIEKNDLRRAYEVANWAIESGMEGRIFFTARGLAYQSSRLFDLALADFQRALKLAPDDAAILAAIGTTLEAQKRYAEAVEAFDAALLKNPNDANSHFRRARSLLRNEQYDLAEAGFLRAIALNPNFVEALGDLASMSGRRGQYDKAKEFADKALAITPGYSMAHYALALVEMHHQQYADVEQRLRYLIFHPDLDIETRGGMCSLLGDALEAQKRYPDAFEAYMRGNQFLQEENSAKFKNARGSDTVRHITAYFETTSAERWKSVSPASTSPDAPSQHVFLLGFMRSGTTLLEQVLASNPDVVALEEKPTLSFLSEKYMRSNEELDALADIHGEELESARAGYWERVRNNAPDFRGKVFVDKQPLNTIRLPVIAKLFPDAKVLFAVRDPRDVVFSCYRRPFHVNTTMFEFLDLEDGARMYAAIMNLDSLYREKLKLNLMEHYYEDMVSDFETRIRAVCDFIGIEWSDSMRDFNKNAPQININSPSAKQVRRPLYGEGIGQWRKYAEQLKPIMPILQPVIERFGYSMD